MAGLNVVTKLPPASVPPPKTHLAPSDAPSIGPAYTVALTGHPSTGIAPFDGQPAGKASDPLPVPEGKKPPQDSYGRACDLMTRLFGVEFYDGKGGLGEYLRTHDRIIVHSPEFKEKLAQWLGIPENMITDKGLDYFFGDQNGKLDGKDEMELPDLIDRLEFLGPIFTAMRAGGGDSAVQCLRTEDIVLYGGDRGGGAALAGVDFAELFRAKDQLFFECMRIAATVIYQSPGSTDADKTQAENILMFLDGKGSNWFGEVPDSMKPLLHSAYWGKFRRATYRMELPYDALIKKPGLKTDLFNGLFLDFIAGHSDKDPAKITHDLPSGPDLETSRGFLWLGPKRTILTEEAIISAARRHERSQRSLSAVPIPADSL
ncbi:MAG TPA: hypothetical protein VMD02_00035 [Candidatus Omnitrophota bacterium]|nr:hypothetical protein [Candidatus Omnitrophota bacterium]